MRGLKLMFASDFHIRDCTSDKYIDALTGMLTGCGADILLLGGDYGESRRAAERLFHALSRAEFPMGIYGVPGNNDTESFIDAASLAEAFPGRMLTNEKCVLRRGAGKLVIGGHDELKYGAYPRRSLFSAGRDEYNLLISHYPLLPSPECGPRPRLMLSGHTHGGQIGMHGFTVYSLGLEKELISHVEGELISAGTRLIVSPGIGVSRFPIRLGCRPLIHLIEFV